MTLYALGGKTAAYRIENRVNTGNVVAIVSVLVTGIVSPLIALLAIRMQLRRSELSVISKENREALDEASAVMAGLIRASGHLGALWRRGVSTDTDDALFQYATRMECGERMLTAHVKLSIRFGGSSGVAKAYGAFNVAIDKYMAPLNEYRKGIPLTDELDAALNEASSAASSARANFIKEAGRAVWRPAG